MEENLIIRKPTRSFCGFVCLVKTLLLYLVGTLVVSQIFALHRSPHVWQDPEVRSFKPSSAFTLRLPNPTGGYSNLVLPTLPYLPGGKILTLPNAALPLPLPFPILLCPCLSYPTLPHPTLPFPLLPNLTLLYPTLNNTYFTLLYPTLPNPTLPYPSLTNTYFSLHHISSHHSTIH